MNLNVDKRAPRHFCQLAPGSGSCLAKLAPESSRMRRIFRSLRQLFIVDGTNPAVYHILRSNAAITYERKRHIKSHHWYVIHPFSRFSMIWEMVVAVTWIIVFFTDPATITFMPIDRPFRAPAYHVFAFTTDLILALYCLTSFFTGKHFNLL